MATFVLFTVHGMRERLVSQRTGAVIKSRAFSSSARVALRGRATVSARGVAVPTGHTARCAVASHGTRH